MILFEWRATSCEENSSQTPFVSPSGLSDWQLSRIGSPGSPCCKKTPTRPDGQHPGWSRSRALLACLLVSAPFGGRCSLVCAHRFASCLTGAVGRVQELKGFKVWTRWTGLNRLPLLLMRQCFATQQEPRFFFFFFNDPAKFFAVCQLRFLTVKFLQNVKNHFAVNVFWSSLILSSQTVQYETFRGANFVVAPLTVCLRSFYCFVFLNMKKKKNQATFPSLIMPLSSSICPYTTPKGFRSCLRCLASTFHHAF